MGNQNSKIQQLQSTETKLAREISLFGGVNILVGIMVGSGIFYLGSFVLMRSGMSQGLALLVWIIGGLVTLISGICYAELGAMMPKAGGSYVYLREAYGRGVAFISGFSGFVLGSSGSIAALALFFSGVLNNVLPFNISPDMQKLIAIALIILLTVINYFGVKFGSWLQNLFTVAKLVPIILILGLGLIIGSQAPNLSLIPAQPVSFVQIISMVAFAVIATLWAYEGWTNLNTVGEELKNPKRNLPLAIIIAILFVMALYVLFNFSIYRVLSLEEIQAFFSQQEPNWYLGTEVASKLMGQTGLIIVGVGMLISIFGATNGCVMVFPRSYYAMARDGLFFRQIGEVHPKTKTPANAIIISAVVSIILVFFRNLGELTNLVVLHGLVFNGLIFFAVIVLRYKYPNMERPYRVWGYPVIPIVATLIMIGLLVNTLFDDFVNSLIGLTIPAVALIIFLAIEHFRRNQKTQGVE